MIKHFFLILFALTVSASVSQTPLDSALIACFPFSGNANDLTGNGNNGTVNGAVLVADRFGNPNSAYSFNGTNQNIQVPGFNSQITSNEHSISFWATATGYATRSAFLMVPDDPSNRYNIHIYYGNTLGNSQTFWDFGDIFSSGRLLNNGSPLPASGTWDHWVFVNSAAGSFMRCYKNGTLVANSIVSSTFNNIQSKDLLIGGGFGVNSSHLWFDGKIDDIRIYKRVLTQADVTALYTATSTCNFCAQVATLVNTTPPANLQVCPGNTISLSASGTGTITWHASLGSTVSIGSGNTFSLQATQGPGVYTYYASASNSCSTSPQIPITVTVNPMPQITIAGSNSVCLGGTVALTASGASNYQWSGGITNGIPFTPQVSSTYTVTGSNSFGCSGSFTHPLSVYPLPQLTVSASPSVVCRGSQATITAAGANTYLWNTNQTSSSFVVTNTIATIYSVTGIDLNGCVNTASLILQVKVCENVGLSGVGLSESDTSLYPNPNDGEFKIAFSNLTDNCRLEIYNPLGQLVYEAELKDKVATVTLRHLANGIYTVKLYEGTQMLKQEKVIVE